MWSCSPSSCAISGGRPPIAQLAGDLGLSPSQVHASLKRLQRSRLIEAHTCKPLLRAVEEFLIHGVKYAFPAQRGEATRGMPTAHAAPPLKGQIIEGDLPPCLAGCRRRGARYHARAAAQGSAEGRQEGPRAVRAPGVDRRHEGRASAGAPTGRERAQRATSEAPPRLIQIVRCSNPSCACSRRCSTNWSSSVAAQQVSSSPTPAASGIRPTRDVDAIVDVASYAKDTALSERLRTLGLAEDATPGAPLCRWRRDDLIVDVMPVDEDILGFSNRWYPTAIETAHTFETAGHAVRVVTPALFIANKLEAFHGRGGNDMRASHDLEDIIVVVDGRPEIVNDVAAADAEVRGYIARRSSGRPTRGIRPRN